MKLISFQIRLEPQSYDLLREKSYITKKSIAQLVREAIDKQYKQKKYVRDEITKEQGPLDP